jgi:hypothetical protein
MLNLLNLLDTLQQLLEPATVAQVMHVAAGDKAHMRGPVQAGPPWVAHDGRTLR